MKKVKRYVRNRIKDPIGYCLQEQVNEPTRSQAWEPFRDLVWPRVWSSVWNNVAGDILW